jgi:hypothetical protein
MTIGELAILIVGVLAALLGSLWLLQGLGIVHIEPILCVAECEALQGPSATWAIAGLATLIGGILAVVYALKGRLRT